MNLQGIVKVIARLDIPYVDEISGWVRTPCPFAQYRHAKGTDNNPGFGIKIEDDAPSHYNCLSCKSKGVLSTLPMQLAHYRDDPSLIALGQEILQEEILGGEIDFGDWEAEAETETKAYPVTNFPSEREHFRDYPSPLRYPRPLAYLTGRGLSVNTIVRLGLRYDAHQERILFPVYDERTGRYAGCSGRTILTPREARAVEKRVQRHNPKFSYPKIRDYGGLQKDRVLLRSRSYGRFRRVPTGGFVSPDATVVVEGLFGFARIEQLRPGGDCAALLGSALTPGKRELLLRAGKPIYWLTDNDLAGDTCLYGLWDKDTEQHDHKTGALYQLYGEVAQFTMTWPDDKDDPEQLTAEELHDMMVNAELFVKKR